MCSGHTSGRRLHRPRADLARTGDAERARAGRRLGLGRGDVDGGYVTVQDEQLHVIATTARAKAQAPMDWVWTIT